MIVRGHMLIDASQPPTPGWVAIDDGRIADVGTGRPPEKPLAGAAEALICPGFIDAHLHLPQIDAVGFDGMRLLDWLDRVIYPAEMRWAEEDFAANQIREAYRRLLRAGTLGFAAFLSSHFHGYQNCVRSGHDLPLRCFVGQAMMDREAPAELLGQELTRIARSERSRVTASVNPRFALACSDDLLKVAQRKMRDDSIVHTHLAETVEEARRIAELFPGDASATAVFDRHGLLGPRTLLAHAIHLDQAEWRLIAQRGCAVVHCPAANTFLQSGVFNMRVAHEHGVRIALGSDIAAGADIAMPRVARAMIDTAKLRRLTLDPDAIVPTPAEAWRMITRGNAEALGWDDAGRIEADAAADLLVLHQPFEFDDRLIGRMLYCWDNSWITARVVNGVLR